MKEKALEILQILNDNNYEAYVVGGFVRDLILNKKTSDIDICTSATPKEILKIFDNVAISDMQYGSVIVTYKGYNFDVTTFRKEIKYEGNRRPIKIKYIKDLKKDLLRRDFTINTLCMDKNGEIIDLLGARGDIDNRILKTVGNPRYRIKEDSLRILRCIRFATILDFDIDKKTSHFLSKYSYLLKTLSMNRKREELDKIFSSSNKAKGLELLVGLNLTSALQIDKLKDITLCSDLLGIWCQLEVDSLYPFTKYEKEEMRLLRELLGYDKLDNYLLYKYGLYLCTVYADIKGISKKNLNTKYMNLKIKSRKDIAINGKEIANILNREPSAYIKRITEDVEIKILSNKLDNNYEEIKNYILKHYR